MPIGADAEDLQVDPAAIRDALLIPGAEGRIVARCPGWNVDVVRRDVHMPKKMLVHEVVIALRVIHGEADVFVEVERRHTGEVELLLLVEPDELLVETQWRGA